MSFSPSFNFSSLIEEYFTNYRYCKTICITSYNAILKIASKTHENVSYVIKLTKKISLIRKEMENYNLIGPHPTILICYDQWEYKGLGFLQLEYAKNGSLRGKLDRSEIWRVIAHISSSLSFIHEKKCIHLDVSPANIFCCRFSDNSNVYKLGDFGSMKKVGTFEEDDEGAGRYVSPEALGFPHSPFEVGPPTDIWSFGIVLYELITNERAPSEGEPYQDLRKGLYQFRPIDDEFRFVIDMLNPNPNLRPTAYQISKFEKCEEMMGIIKTQRIKKSIPIVPNTPASKLPKGPPEAPYTKKYHHRVLNLDSDDEFTHGADL